jgi:uncharacterized membrane protein
MKNILQVAEVLNVVMFMIGCLYKLSGANNSSLLLTIALVVNLIVIILCAYHSVRTKKSNNVAWIVGMILLPGIIPILYAFTSQPKSEG